MFHFKEIYDLAKAHHCEPVTSDDAIRRFLIMELCLRYNLHPKDPVILQYSDDELLYWHHRMAFQVKDPREVDETLKKAADDLDWVKKQLSEMKKQPENKPLPEFRETSISFEEPKTTPDPSKV